MFGPQEHSDIAAHKRPGIVTVFAWSRSLKKTMVHYIDKPALLYATTYVLQLVVIHTSEAEQDALFGNSARVGGLKIGGHSSVYSCHRNFELTNSAISMATNVPEPLGSKILMQAFVPYWLFTYNLSPLSFPLRFLVYSSLWAALATDCSNAHSDKHNRRKTSSIDS